MAPTQFINTPTTVVTEMLESFVQSHPGVQLLDGFPDVKVVVRAQLDKTKVAVISGETTYNPSASVSCVLSCGLPPVPSHLHRAIVVPTRCLFLSVFVVRPSPLPCC